MPKEPWSPPDKGTADRWAEILEMLGTEMVGRLIVDIGTAFTIGGTGGVPITRGFAEDWVRRQRRAAARRDRWLLAFTLVAALAASIAAWPVVRDWRSAIIH
jgi:hypothetical protein